MTDNKQKFKIGDLVQLKSGGPKMTVNSVTFPLSCTCVWFAGTKSNKENFNYEALQSYVEPEPKK
ncbi:YodC family protein [Desulfovibrio cuneatus]|uniref:YodC family protein n=1 Tax=Desulfovibrio cuneatus TaxID=159728 RepID=UPI0004889428|nr:DUF2158 domain-containing protein [Desulfovibrio cuneatus]